MFLLQALPARAEYPEKKVTWVVQWAPESSPAAMARIIGDAMAKELGQDIVVVIMPGGTGSKATKHVLSKPADGYTILDMWWLL